MNKTAIRLVTVGVVAGLAVAGCSSSKKSGDNGGGTTNTATSGGGGGSFDVGVILPDTQTSPRWETQDRPSFEKAFKDAGLKADIQNAGGDTTKFVQIGDAMIQEGVKVIILTALDSSSGAQVESKAAAAGIKTIDYDRLVLGGADNYYISFDNVKVGQLQGQGLIDCLTAKGITNPSIIEIDGAPTDNNATLFAQGYNSVLQPLYDAGTAKKLGEKAVDNWGAHGEAGPVFENLLTAAGGKVDGVLVANDSMAQQVLTIEQKHGISAPVTGQDASVEGLQAVLSGKQCGTVFKDTNLEAPAASKLAIALIKGEDTSSMVNGTTKDSQTGKDVPSVLETPVWITPDKVKDVIAAGGQKASDVCTGDYAALCTQYGVS